MDLLETHDGSFTIKHPVLNELYHSIHGAIQESEHVFIQNGLALHAQNKTVSIFEMGFGTGLNALTTYRFAKENNLRIKYYTIETHPIKIIDAKKLNYTSNSAEISFFESLHVANWNEMVEVLPNFDLYKLNSSIEEEDLSFIADKIDLIYFDAFAPSAQAHLWELPILEKMYNILKKGGHLSTYCAKGQFKRDLKKAAFSVQAVPGPPGKREMTLGFKS